MGREIERKFLLRDDSWRQNSQSKSLFRQAYLNSDPERTVRVRIQDELAFLTIKGKTDGITRSEFEYAIPLADARQLLALCETEALEKYRHTLDYQGHRWEIDEFVGVNAGLVVAEIELVDEQESFIHPPWLGEEISHDPRYFNSALSRKPFSRW